MKVLRGIIALQLILLFCLTSSQYDPYTIVRTTVSFANSTTVSKYNGDIYVGGLFTIQRYDKQGYFKSSVMNHSDVVIQLFSTNQYIISVSRDGKVIKWDNIFFSYVNSFQAPPGVINADVGNGYIALNYGKQIAEYSLDFMSFNMFYFSGRNLTFFDVCYSKMDYGFYLWAVAPGYRFRFSQGFNSYFQYSSSYSFKSIDLHPSKNLMVVVSSGGFIYEIDMFNNQNLYYLYSDLDLATYSPNGDYVLSSYFSDQVIVWDANRNGIQRIDGWVCTIVDIGMNSGVVSVLDACGNLGILYESGNFILSIWFIIVASFIVVIIASVICIQIFRKKRLVQQANQGAYSNQGFSPNWNQPQTYPNTNYNANPPIIGNQGFSANVNPNPYGTAYGNQQNQGFNNQNQGYQPPNRNW